MQEKNFELYKSELNLEKLYDIDEERLPMIINKSMDLVEKSNQRYEIAKNNEYNAREKVNEVLCNADNLINRAKGVGANQAKQHSFLGFEWTTKNDEIEAVKANLQELVDCGIESAEAQKELVEVQMALSESQTAMLDLQKTQLEYQSQTADLMKFLYGLSAHNMASTQSIYINLEAILSGAGKEKLGEMAYQQLLMAMDQIKNQENLLFRIRENRNSIKSLSDNVHYHESEIHRINIKDKEHDKLILEGQEHDEKQDLELKTQAEKDREHDKLILERLEHDEKQDLELKAQAEKDKEHDKNIDELQEKILKLNHQIMKLTDDLDKINKYVLLLDSKKTDKKFTYIAYLIAFISIFIIIVQMLL